MIKYPDYTNSIVNVSNSILKHFNAEQYYPSLDEVDQILSKDYQNVVYVVLDGLGKYNLDLALNNSFFQKHQVKTIDSVFPPTTVAATTAIQTGMAPLQTAWLGWTQYFEDFQDNITVFLNRKESDGQLIPGQRVADLKQPTVFLEKILTEKGYYAKSISPFGDLPYQNLDDMFKIIKNECDNKEKKFLYVYHNNPDSLMHEFGVQSNEVKAKITELNDGFEKLSSEVENTVFIIVADHGQIDSKNLSFEDYPEILACLKSKPSIEPRAISFRVKDDCHDEFLKLFNSKFANTFKLYSKDEFLASNLLGNGKEHLQLHNYLGDYLALAVSNVSICNSKKQAEAMIGMHAGLLKEEVEVPLIIIEKD